MGTSQMPTTPPPPGGSWHGNIDWGELASAAVDVGMGVLGATGQAQTNRANRDIAREQMAFQERMSNTAIQRQVEDYRAAGLNPALAYARGGASTPTGSSSTIGDIISAGVNNAMRSRQLRQELRNAAETEGLLREQRGAAKAANQRDTALAGKYKWEGDLAEQQFRFNHKWQPAQLNLMETENFLKAMMKAGAKNTSDFEEYLGKGSRGITFFNRFMQMTRSLIHGDSRD